MEKLKILMTVVWAILTIGSFGIMVMAMCIAEWPKEVLTATIIFTTIGLLTTTALAEDL